MLHLEGTYSRPPSHLSWQAGLALEYGQAWLRRAGGLKVPAPAVLRRALAVYAEHLAFANPRAEFRAVKAACEARPPEPEERQMAELRLLSVPPSEPLPAFCDVLRSPARAREVAQLVAGAEALAETVLAELPRRRRATAAM
jgi:hypothetical protein